MSADTIAAIATAPGKGGVGIVRVSGPNVKAIYQQLFHDTPQHRTVSLKSLYHEGDLIDKGVVLYFQGPHSFTGEDVLEFQGHGGPVVLNMILSCFLEAGARMATPGEFSQRAFLNNKMDLTQVEAVADLIHATTQQSAISAQRSLQGVFSQQINALATQLLHLRVFVEAALDFPDEDLDFIQEGKILEQLEAITQTLDDIFQSAKRGCIQRDGLSVVICGQPNAGKSSLMNALTLQETAIVTPIPGTTRDVLKEYIDCDGLAVHITDTAGIRDNPDAIEKEGILRAQKQMNLCDRILLLIDITQTPLMSNVEADIIAQYRDKITLVYNKVDLATSPMVQDENAVYISAKNKIGIDALISHLKNSVGMGEEKSNITARKRHVMALSQAQTYTQEATHQIKKHKALELAAHSLKEAHDALGEIVGRISSDALLGEIFSNFCIGK